MKHIVSFSGGRTSAYLVYLMEKKRKAEGLDVEYIFCDTGAEHPKTYEFIRNVINHFGIKLTCLRGNFNQPIGDGLTVDVVSIDEIGHNLINGPFAQLMRKYGTPTVAAAWCTTRMKEDVANKYFFMMGYDKRKQYLGMRTDEPARYFGLKAWQILRKHQYPNYELHRLFNEARSGSDLKDWWLTGGARELIVERVKSLDEKGIHYLAELEEVEKQDVLDFWKLQPFDLEIDEHLGNCVFCIKKSVNKVALAMRDEEELLTAWKLAIDNGSDRLSAANGIDKGVMYRGNSSIETIEQQFSELSRDELKDTIRSMRDTHPCAESCEPFGQIDLF